MLCKYCNVDKPGDSFYKSSQRKCKACVTKAVLANRHANLDHFKEYDKSRSSLEHRVAARRGYQATDAYRKSHNAASARWEARFPERRKAQVVVSNAVRDGLLVPQPCWCCGEKAEAHHPDYGQPLDVVWLCTTHHKEVHAMAKEA